MTLIDDIREDLKRLRRRWIDGEIDDATYQRMRQALLEEVTPSERAQLEGTPLPRRASGTRPSVIGPRGAGGTLRSPEAEVEPGVGATVLDFELTRELGRGGFGVVFEARDVRLDKACAVKVLDRGLVARADDLARFRREVALMQDLTHPHVVRVYEYREDLARDLALVSMELVRGTTVRELHRFARDAGTTVPAALVQRILEQALEALVEAHGQGVIHRDVSPANLLLAGGAAARLLGDPDADPKVKLVDFGIAGLVERSELSARSRTMGTVTYLAPELHDNEAAVTPKVDVYSLGAVAYELLAGKPPLVTGHRPVGEQAAGTPKRLAETVTPMVAIDPEERSSSSDALEILRLPTVETVSPNPGDLWVDPVLGMRFRYCPPGTFMMGSPEDDPDRDDYETLHDVTLTRGYWLLETPVTQGQYRGLTGESPSSFEGSDDLPVEGVSWYDAVRFANRLSERAGLEPCYRIGAGDEPEVSLLNLSRSGYRLPTEAEWERAARAGTGHLFAGSDDLDEVGWYEDNSGGETHPVARKRANAWGLHDMSGNVWEWVWDWFGEYPARGVADPVGPDTGSARVTRGGGWSGTAGICRSAYRAAFHPGSRLHFLGFRLASTAD